VKTRKSGASKADSFDPSYVMRSIT
jgi:hypothetical protein